MTNYREILRLHSLGLNKTEIAASCQCARNTVAATLQRAANCGLQWPLPEELSDKQLSERLFPTSGSMNTPPETVPLDRTNGALRPLKWCMVTAVMVH